MHIGEMLSVVIGVEGEDDEGLARTLASLVPAVVEGVLRDCVVIDSAGSPAIGSVADAAGCRHLTGTPAGTFSEALGGMSGQWIMMIEPGVVLENGWFREVAEFVERAEAAGRASRLCAAFTFASQAYGPAARLREAWRFIAGMFGRVVSGQGLIASRQALRGASVTRLPPRPRGRVVILRAKAFAPEA